jgi:hypothetical protein
MVLFRSSGGLLKYGAMKVCSALIQREDEISFVNEYISADDFEKYGLHDIGAVKADGEPPIPITLSKGRPDIVDP